MMLNLFAVLVEFSKFGSMNRIFVQLILNRSFISHDIVLFFLFG
jgi:hypothetical protein